MFLRGGEKLMKTQAETWDKLAPKVNFTLEPLLTKFQKLVPTNARILDYGCGYGRLSALLHDHGYNDTVGYDTSSAIIERGHKERPDIILKSYAPPVMPEQDNSFDACVCCAVLTCLPDPKDRAFAVEEMTRVLKPGGLLYIAEFLQTPDKNYDPELPGIFVSRIGVTMKHFTCAELEAVVSPLQTVFTSEETTQTLSGETIAAYHLFVRK